ncbi:hypothetical protein VCHC36A1_1056 [Vibrio cholerae HC-36A1]|nr:hypothetical protein VCHC36A1_1056 [Vibrio cholerae HC-36A1]
MTLRSEGERSSIFCSMLSVHASTLCDCYQSSILRIYSGKVTLPKRGLAEF